MSYWKGLVMACVFDIAWIMGSPSPIAHEPMPLAHDVARWIEPASGAADDALLVLEELGRLEDSLVGHLQQHPEDVDAMAQLADLYLEHEWYDPAIGPLARALQLDPSRRGLWSMLDRALEGAGLEQITDAELTRRAQQFVKAVEMWGHGC